MIINTRPTILSSKLNSISNDKNIEVINAPLSLVESLPFNVDTINLKSRLQENGYYKNIIFTSQASAIFGLANLKELAEMKSFNIFAVGPATKSVIAKAGINSLTPKEPSSRSLFTMIQKHYPGRNLLLCGENSNKYLQVKLEGDIDEIICYKLVYSKANLDLIEDGPKITLIYNFLTFLYMFESLDLAIIKNKIFVVASKQIKEKILEITKDIKLEIYVAKDPSDNSMLEKAKEII